MESFPVTPITQYLFEILENLEFIVIVRMKK